MNDDSTVKFAVVGCGHIGRRHATMISNNRECELVALCDTLSTEEAGIGDYKVPYFVGIDDLLNSDLQFDILCIATPNGFHEEHALKGIRTGHHIVVEKPMTLSKAGCEHIIYEALHYHKQVFCVMQNRYSPPAIWMKDLLREDKLGKIFLVQINCYWNRDERYYLSDNWHGTKELDGGTLYTQFSHFIDIMYWFFGDIKDIQSRMISFNHYELTDFEDSGFVNFEFVNGGIGAINYSTSVWDRNLESSMTIIAEKGTIKIGGQYMNRVEYCNIQNYQMPDLPASGPPIDYGLYKGSANNHHFVFQNVVDVMKGRKPITTNALEGMKVVEIIERIYDSENDRKNTLQ